MQVVPLCQVDLFNTSCIDGVARYNLTVQYAQVHSINTHYAGITKRPR